MTAYHKKGNYGAQVVTRNDGEGFDVYFLYNMTNDRNGDVWDRKQYKTRKTADRKVEAYFKMQGVAA